VKPLVTDFSEFDFARCPMPERHWEYVTDDAAETTPLGVTECGEDLYLEWTFNIPIDRDMSRVEADEAPGLGCTHVWQVVCANGHVVARSTGDEYAEPFTAEVLGLGANS
jgi:hypothetical protein